VAATIAAMSQHPSPAETIGWFRPTMPGRDMPASEARSRVWAIRTIAVIALVVTVAYLLWRATATLALNVWWVSIPLYIMEIHAAVGLGLFTFSLWDVDRRPKTREVLRTRTRVAVLIPTYNEDLEVLMPTLAAALEMRVKHDTWVLDDGNRPEVAQLARELGARYLTRPTNEHAKAGNLNHALGIIEADLIAVLDADHVASPDFLTHTLGYFDDPKVALVQTPQEFYNLESFEHERGGVTKVEPLDAPTSALFHEQVLFYRILQPGKNRWGGAFWCGTGAVVRVSALKDVGGVATDTITEDIHTTIRLHRKGWQTVYHNEVLARGLAASDAGTYQLQRHRWGTGAMQVLRRENPLLVSGLTLPQRLSYGATLLGWFDSWRSLGYLLLPLVVIATGAVPIAADALTFMVFFGTTFLLGQLSLRVLSRGCHRPILSILFEFVRMTPNFMATMTLFTNRRAAFRVTPKGRTGNGRNGAHVSPILTAMLLLSLVAAGWYAATLLGFTPVVYAIPWAVHAAFAWMVVNVGLVWLAIHRVRASRYAAERRSSVRFATDFPGRVDGIETWVRDLSLTGARLEVPDVSVIAPTGRLVVEAGRGRPIVLDGVARTSWTDRAGRTMVGFEFVEGQYPARARLALALFGARTTEARRLTAARRAAVKAQDRADALEDLVAASSAA
jgi:cellulose synthase/poly-beta-1,6-N-acetylglucosamine synthase-like glycosyltransferase